MAASGMARGRLARPDAGQARHAAGGAERRRHAGALAGRAHAQPPARGRLPAVPLRRGLVSMLASRDFKRLGDLAAATVVVYQAEKVEANKNIPAAQPIAPPVPLSLEEQRAVLELAERSVTLTQERVEELAELPAPLVGSLHGEPAARRLIGIANHIAGRT